MCSVSAPAPVEVEKPVFVRNPYLDEIQQDTKTAAALRRGRSSLVIPANDSIGTAGRGGSKDTGDADSGGGSKALSPISGRGVRGTGVGKFKNATPTYPGGDETDGVQF